MNSILYGFLNEVFGPLLLVLLIVPAILCAIPLLIYIAVKVIREIRRE